MPDPIQPAELPNNPTYPATVKAPTNAHPALASEFYNDNERGLQALANRTAWLFKLITGRVPPDVPPVDVHAGVYRIRNEFNVETMVALEGAKFGDLCNLIHDGLYTFYPDYEEYIGTPDGLMAVASVGTPGGAWVHVGKGVHGAPLGTATLDAAGKVPTTQLRNAVMGVYGFTSDQGVDDDTPYTNSITATTYTDFGKGNVVNPLDPTVVVPNCAVGDRLVISGSLTAYVFNNGGGTVTQPRHKIQVVAGLDGGSLIRVGGSERRIDSVPAEPIRSPLREHISLSAVYFVTAAGNYRIRVQGKLGHSDGTPQLSLNGQGNITITQIRP